MNSRFLPLFLGLAVAFPTRADDAARAERFEKKIRPIFATHCVSCHGPKKQKGGLRLDRRDSALAGGETGKAIVPGTLDDGELIKAVRYDSDGYKMPPTGKLPKEAIDELERWIKDGAHWPSESAPKHSNESAANWFEARRSTHWCWQPVKRPSVPSVKNSDWATGPIDRFLVTAMEREGIEPSRDADRLTLLRRLHFVLTGLPPTSEDLKTFERESDEAAFERVVDRLLASPTFGEHWARHWLDLVRYSETLGHEFDFDIPNAWRYRDYVVRAINADLPYNQFIVEHLAGDLLPQPRLDVHRVRNESIVGTGFWWFGEAKQAAVDVRAEQADRVDNQIDVIGKAFLGLTVSCARCHDHKFDAITASDYYSLYGFVKSTRYSQASTAPTSRWREEIAARSRVEQEIRRLVSDDWKRQIRELPESKKGAEILAESKTVDELTADESAGVKILGDARSGFARWRRNGPAAMLAEAHVGDPVLNGNSANTVARLRETATFDSRRWSERFQGSLRSPTFRIDHPRLHVLASGSGARFSVVVDNFNVIRPPIYGGLRAKLDESQPKWRTIDLSAWIGREAYVEFLDQSAADFGDPDRSEYPKDAWFAVEQVLLSKEGPPPARAANLPQRNDQSESEFDSKSQSQSDIATNRLKRAAMDSVAAWSSGAPMDPRDARVINLMLEGGLLHATDDALASRLMALHQQKLQLDRQSPDSATTPAAEDGDGTDEAVFVRGNSKKLGPVSPRKFLTAIDGESGVVRDNGSGRLALAKRIVDPKNPLVARVVVNRVWRHVFGRGLVESPDNFGALGEAPSHPELLDFLADEFVRDGWSVKRLIRRLISTRAFRSSSVAESNALTRDPQNRWFARANVRRLEAEPLRDALLSMSGNRRQTMEGPGTLVYLDAFADGRGKPASGPLDGNGRRTIYLSVRRNFPSSLLSAFDSPIPAGPVGKRSVSNVPAQALILLNDPFVVQSAKRCAESLIDRHPKDAAARLDDLYLSAFGRSPTEAERTSASRFLEQQKSGRTGNVGEAAAWADLCHAMFNAKEFLFLR